MVVEEVDMELDENNVGDDIMMVMVAVVVVVNDEKEMVLLVLDQGKMKN
jgi:hypothetical protein